MEALFWIFIALIMYAYLGYYSILKLAAAFRTMEHRTLDYTPSVTLTMASRNNAAPLKAKIDNILSLDYPPDKLEVVIGSDGSTDETVAMVRGFASNRVRVLDLPWAGKATANNAAVAAARGEIIIDTSSGGWFEPHFIRTVVRHFIDDKVGAVTGENRFVNADNQVENTEGAYWRYEFSMRGLESSLGLLAVSNGAVLAWRRTNYRPIHSTSDVDNMVPLQTVTAGLRVIHEPEARCLGEEVISSLKGEVKARIRQVTRSQQDIFRGLFQLGLIKRPQWAWVLISRRLCRWWVPLFIIGAFVTNLALVGRPLYTLLFLCQLAAYGLGAWGLARPGAGPLSRAAGLAATFLAVNYAFFRGTINAARRKRIAIW